MRLAAYVIDSVIVFFGLLFVRLFSSGIFSMLEGTALGGNVLFDYTLKDIVLYGFQVMYFVLFLYYTGTTPGKRLLNLRVVSAEEEKLSFTDVLYRETIGRFLCGLSVGIGYIMAGVDREKRGLHDMLCDTRVIYARRVKVYPVFQGPPDMQAPFVPRQVTPQGGAPTPDGQYPHTEQFRQPSQEPMAGWMPDGQNQHEPHTERVTGGVPDERKPAQTMYQEDENKERNS